MRTATFENSVNVLVKAYLNDELLHGDCMACAVGNLIRDVMPAFQASPLWADNGKITSVGYGWSSVFCTVDKNYQIIQPERYVGNAKAQIDATGYSRQDLQRIEEAFEYHHPTYNNTEDEEAMFNGLMAVVDVLASIHNVDLSIKENAKLLFVKSPN